MGIYYSVVMKRKISVSIDDDLLKWAESEIKKKRFASLSHALNLALNELKLKK
jgi:Arc/MetJ-type ribon-helix-helix transcriptional regulator